MEDPTTTPAMPPPPGVESNFVNPESRQNQLVIVSIVCIAISVVAISLRTYTRAIIMRSFSWADGALLFGLASFVSFTSVQIYAGNFGQGAHLWDVTEADLSVLLKLLNIIEILYGPTMGPFKFVVLRQIESIFLNHTHKTLAKNSILGLIWANSIFYFAITVSFICACVPRVAIWNPAAAPDAVCTDSNISIIATSAINVVSDVTILIVPVVGIWQLRLPLKKKIGAAAVFAIGIFAIVTSIVRLYYSVQLTQTHDVTWAIEPVAAWAMGEFTTVILVACFPTLPLFFNHFFGKSKQSSQYQYHSSGFSGTGGAGGSSSKGGRSANQSRVYDGTFHDDSESTTGLAKSGRRADVVVMDTFENDRIGRVA